MTRHSIGLVVLLVGLTAQTALAQTTTPPPPPTPLAVPAQPHESDESAFRSSVRAAQTAFQAGDFAAAASSYESALAAMPGQSEAAYNLGVCRYRAGEFAAAADAFASAGQSSQAGLAAHAMYNQGTSAYAGAVQQLGNQDPTGVASATAPGAATQAPDMEAATKAVEAALTHFKDAATADPLDADSRFNAEAAFRLLKELRKQQEKQQQDQQKQDQQNQDQKQQDQQKQDQKQQDQQKQQQGEEKQPQNQEQQGEEQKPQPKPGESEPKDQEQPQDQQDQQDQQPSKPDGDQQKQAQTPKPKEGKMSREEAERLLQAVRDREKLRREAQQQAKRTRQAPVAKDW